MEQTDSANHQHLYMQEIFDYFHQHGGWPAFRHLERELNKKYPELEIEEVAASLPEGFSNPVTWNDTQAYAILTVPAVSQCNGSAGDLSDFIWAIRLCVDIFFNSQEDIPSFSSDDLHNTLSMSELSIRKVGLLIQHEPGIYSSFGRDTDTTTWRIEIARDIRRFRDVQTIEEYLDKRTKPTRTARQVTSLLGHSAINSIAQTWMIEPADELRIHPEIRSKCWNLYLYGNYDNAILNATKALEVAVRTKAHLAEDSVGAALIAEALKPDKPLLRYSKIKAEQEGMMSLLRGMIQVFKNPQSHRFVGVQERADCLGVLFLCSSLLYAIEDMDYTGTP